MRFRQVHLDFHTSEKIDNIGEKFDKKQFQDALKIGHINSITLFAKCHHGWSYYPSNTNPIHPYLKFDLFGEQIKAAHEIDVKTVAYISAGLDEKFAVCHPECLARKINEQTKRTSNFTLPGYHLLCFNTGYLNYLIDQVIEVCGKYDIDGLFFDIASPSPCYCRSCANRLLNEGKDPENEEDVLSLAEEVYLNYTSAIRAAVDSVKPGINIFHNGGSIPRGKRYLIKANSHIEIESLPTGGWGYDNLPMTARYLQQHNMEFIGMTGKFHLSWGEFGGYKHQNALIYETSLAVANGGKCSVGDQLHPLGIMDNETYRLIGTAYKQIEEKEPWLDNVESVAVIGLFSYNAYLAARPAVKNADNDYRGSDIGALRVLLESHYLFDIIDEESDFGKYKLIILPDNIEIDGGLKNKLDSFLISGGKLLASGRSGLIYNNNKDETPSRFQYDFGVTHIGSREIRPIYINPVIELEDMKKAGYVVYSESEKVILSGGEELATVNEPYFERSAKHFCSHCHAPEKLSYSGVGAAAGSDGIYISSRVFREYANVGSLFVKQLLKAGIDRCLAGKNILEIDLPSQGIVTLMDQKSRSRFILHLLFAIPIVKGTGKIEVIEKCVPLLNINVKLTIKGKKITNVYLAPSMEKIPFEVQPDGCISFCVPRIFIHGMIALEYENL